MAALLSAKHRIEKYWNVLSTLIWMLWYRFSLVFCHFIRSRFVSTFFFWLITAAVAECASSIFLRVLLCVYSVSCGSGAWFQLLFILFIFSFGKKYFYSFINIQNSAHVLLFLCNIQRCEIRMPRCSHMTTQFGAIISVEIGSGELQRWNLLRRWLLQYVNFIIAAFAYSFSHQLTSHSARQPFKLAQHRVFSPQKQRWNCFCQRKSAELVYRFVELARSFLFSLSRCRSIGIFKWQNKSESFFA